MAKRAVISEMVQTSRTIKKGTPDERQQNGWQVTFRNPDSGQDMKTFFAEKFNAESIQACLQVGVGGSVDTHWEKRSVNGKDFWNCVKVLPISAGQPPAPPVQPGIKPASATTPPVAGGCRKPEEMVRQICVDFALSFENVVAELSKNEKFKNLLKPTKVTADTLFDDLLARAAKLELFITGEYSPVTESDSKDLDQDGVDLDQPDIPDEPPDVPADGKHPEAKGKKAKEKPDIPSDDIPF